MVPGVDRGGPLSIGTEVALTTLGVAGAVDGADGTCTARKLLLTGVASPRGVILRDGAAPSLAHLPGEAARVVSAARSGDGL
mmetsp:Transcript_40725/g.75730  ORF Transcript_40725/g.75730 Transcript_40725/m.75730 type:complete len:82 (+) Transcript_40725:569-814(+)